ncbi:ABC-F family ATP-binding cassette domain-containing protein [Sutcliffiella horikoshii]|uniref:ABC-F family ATP-binding cassette domain-containing protein n=1 Tax=Sutcliffiella horikoshii TaxID=79883 RepID=UPI00204106F2|nr:ABC-F family ATP-binding cassette domain-containing protein [Sutcliffiella horikoshii]MCM3620321.1 ABC-F family ATP-binding cassette domain-containing protein [Sutcliffiella horikoshii]
MIILQVNQLTKYFGADLILSNIKLEVQSKDRIALVGRNGAGKSTLLKIISNQLSFDSGDLIKPKGVSIGYLAQDTGLQTERSIWNEMLTVFSGLRELEAQMRTLEAKMGDHAFFEDEVAYARILKEYDEVQEAFKQQGGFQYEADIRSVLHGLRFSEYDYETPIETLSGGQRTRLALAKLLLTKPDLLILDEPTNHLDIDTLSWLENYLQGYPGALLIVSHDRYFLDKVVNIVYEISRKQSAKFIGNYSKYLEQKAEQYEREMKMFEKQQGEIAKLQDFVAKNLARASTTKRAQSRRRQLEKMDVMDRPKGDEKSASIMFDIDRQSGNDVLKARDLAVSYDTNPVFRHVDFSMSRGDSVALVGPNGIGKSTLLKTLVGKLKPLEGTFSFGANISISYYDQQQADLTSNKTVLAELWDEYPQKMEKEIRTVLGNFLFSGDDVLKPVSTLSGGEKARLALSKLMMERSNVLILDEPTNHLDLDSKEILENALIDYPGTILFVSHDRYFINRLATKVYELSTVGATEYLGDYDYYVEKKEEALELERLEAETASLKRSKVTSAVTVEATEKMSYEQEKEAKRLERQRKRRVEEIEKEMEELEQKIEHNESELCLPEVYQDHEKVLELNTANEAYQERLLALMEEWEELV